MSALLETGTVVYLRRSGMARVGDRSEHEVGGVQTLCYEIHRETGLVRIPVEKAHLLIRPPVGTADAEAMLEALRKPGIEADASLRDQAHGPARKIQQTGSPLEHAELLRKMYALDAPLTHWDRMGIHHLEELVLDEIAYVLKLSRANLTAEMRTLHPAMRTPAL